VTDGNGRIGRPMVGEAPTPAQAATPEDRAAVDAVLEQFPRFQRTLLLPVLQAVQARRGGLSHGLLGYLGERVRVPFAEVYGVASFYALLATDHPAVRVRLCSGVPCILAGAEQLADSLRRWSTVDWRWFPCIGQCDRAPAALIDEDPVYRLTSASILEAVDGRH
jgi:NADH-quinone oxidoreductase subunit F